MEESDLSALAQRRNATECIAVLASDGNLNESVAAKSMSDNLELVLSLLLSIQPLLSSQDQASFAKDTRLGVAVT